MRRTLVDYGRVNETKILEKTTVVYPAIREVPAEKIRYSDEKVSLLFSGDFFRKGGVNVVDVFEELQKRYPGITLRICCDEKIDFNTSNHHLKAKYLGKIRSNRSILFGRVPRHQMLVEILPETDIYLLPIYNEAFGFAILEAMAFGIPVIATNQFAIPEILQDGQSGLLVDISQYDVQKMFRGYAVHELPEDFRQRINEQLRSHLESLIESAELRKRIGSMALSQAQSKFSFKLRNQIMGKIYHDAAN